MDKIYVLAPSRIDVPAEIRHVVYIIRPQYVLPQDCLEKSSCQDR